MTADFGGRPFETIEAHVLGLHAALSRYRFSNFLHLSSTRVYRGAASPDDAARLEVSPAELDDTYSEAD